MKKKSSSVSKNKVKNLSIKSNTKINEIYIKFRSKVFQLVAKKNFVVAVSGGPDSLTLAYFSKLYSKEFKNRVKYVIVDHKIRKNSTQEANKVKKILLKEDIRSIILTNKTKLPFKNIQSNARKVRYSLISKYCLKVKSNYLLTAHHQDDQIENFLIRLFRGSGLVGLSSMSEVSEITKKCKIIRPFLGFQKKQLINVSKKVFKKYVIDPTNQNPLFLRTRIRKYRKIFDQEGFDMKKIIKTIKNLSVAKKALEFYKSEAIKKNVSIKKNKSIVDIKLLKSEAEEVVFRVFCDIFYKLTLKNYPPRSKKILKLISLINKKDFKKATLAGLIIEKHKNLIFITK